MKRSITISKSIFPIIIMILISLFNRGYGQEGKLKKAQKKYENYAYIDASAIYLEVANSGYASEELFKRIANTFYFNARYDEAANWYEKLFELNGDLEPIYYLRYSQSLLSKGASNQAEHWFDVYADRAGLTKKELSSAVDYKKIIEENSGRYTIKNLEALNTTGIDFGNAINNGLLYYASTKDTSSIADKKSGWDGLSFLDVFKAESNDGKYAKGSPIAGDINTEYHESSVCLTRDGKIMYFTRNNTTPEDRTSKSSRQRLKVYRVRKENGKWGKVEDLPFNSDLFSNAHPALSNDEKYLYFSSDRPGGYGQTDLYVVEINEEGSFGNPINLGSKINTLARETFPFISSKDELYFSSDGHYGLGGLDVFYVQMEDGKVKGSLLNVGKPINSPADDFAFSVDPNTKKGFFSSNREGGKGYDDIYSIVEEEDIKDVLKTSIYGTVTDKKTKETIQNVTISILNEKGETYKDTVTDEKGMYRVNVERFKQYLVRASKEEYDSEEIHIKADEEEQEVNLELLRNIYRLEEGDDLSIALGIDVIYFDYDKADIRPDAAADLEKVIAVMNKYPNISIEVKSHTDSRGSDSYNLELSDRRARSTIDYMIKRGIKPKRLSGRGYGETQLVNRCANEVECPEEEHQENRRSEFILSFGKN